LPKDTRLISTALYIHIPFCRQRCTYCDFSTWAHRDELVRPYVDALCSELSLLHQQLPNWRPDTVYLGGGTPSLLPTDLARKILTAAQPGPAAEITLEANPDTLDPAALGSLRQMGVSRLSLGMQTSDAGELALLGRLHDFRAVERGVRWARRAGFDNLNLDLIYGLPAQQLTAWESSLDAALDLHPEHLSLYSLSVEPDTPLSDSIREGSLPPPDPDLAADMYDMARERLADANYVHYEISNWARPGHQCRHNLAYWRNEPYLGAGAAAWGHWPHGPTAWRMRNSADPQDYIQQMAGQHPLNRAPAHPPRSPACAEEESIAGPLSMAETMFMGLRLIQEGVSRRAFRARFGTDPLLTYRDVLADLAAKALIAWDDERVFLPQDAILIANQVFSSFLPPEE
jgi:oxygen-independent coproporphyrinogen-3 oxidase